MRGGFDTPLLSFLPGNPRPAPLISARRRPPIPRQGPHVRHPWFRPRFGLLPLAVACAGCGMKVKMPVVPVEGKILFADGKPLAAGTRLMFTPGEGGTGTAVGVTGDDGSIKVTHVSGAKGAEIGKYTILLAAPEDGDKNAFFKM